ncbi:MAG TPA: glycosyltransferase [Gemmataceae bacterium]|jgi:hypothetical protein|nr:glycosyltransferase [Gemmataceae bacterium]
MVVKRMPHKATVSLIVPTRQRTDRLRVLLDSLAATAANPAAIEVVMVIDADDRDSIEFRFDQLALRRAVVEPGLHMGALNMAGYEAASGAYLMLLNDDVVVRTKGWDRKVLTCCRQFSDDIALIHTNDTVFGDTLCTFPIVSRTFCELAGGICPRAYVRYRIDDHIEDVFNLLAVLGERRTVYLPHVVFEHRNFVENAQGLRQYFSDPAILALDGPRFDALLTARKELALKLKEHIAGPSSQAEMQNWRSKLATVDDSLALRVTGRQRLGANARDRFRLRTWKVAGSLASTIRRIRACVRHKGYRGLARAAWKRVVSFAV